MSADDDLIAMLPEPRPPRPAARDAAIGAAMRRFDGAPPIAADRSGAATRPRFNRPQIAAFATIALVAMVGLPVWMSGDHSLERVAPDTVRAPAAPLAAERQVPPAADAAAAARAPGPAAARGRAAVFAPPAAPAPAVVEPPSHHGDKGDWAAESAAPAPMMEPMPAPAPAPEPAFKSAADSSADTRDVIVTGSRVAAPSVAARGRVTAVRGDWNACTVDDPSRDFGACEALIQAAAPGSAGRAAAHIADGLLSGWQSDFSGAVAAFDRAIEIAPKSSAAYLNRGLAYAHRGMSEHAIADLDRAVRYAPNAARGYYQRSLLLRRRGETAAADTDLRRAVALDPSYQAAIR